MKTQTELLSELLDSLNANYGIGQITSINGELEVATYKPWGCHEQQRHFHCTVRNGKMTVRFCGHQLTAKLQ